jgi:hypothetical protein
MKLSVAPISLRPDFLALGQHLQADGVEDHRHHHRAQRRRQQQQRQPQD